MKNALAGLFLLLFSSTLNGMMGRNCTEEEFKGQLFKLVLLKKRNTPETKKEAFYLNLQFFNYARRALKMKPAKHDSPTILPRWTRKNPETVFIVATIFPQQKYNQEFHIHGGGETREKIKISKAADNDTIFIQLYTKEKLIATKKLSYEKSFGAAQIWIEGDMQKSKIDYAI